MTKKQSLQNWKIAKKPLYAGNEVIVDLELPAIEEQSTSKTVEIQSTSEINIEESSIRGTSSSSKEPQAKERKHAPRFDSEVVCITMLNFEGVRCLKIRMQENTSNAVAFFGDSILGGLCLKNVDIYSSSGARPQHVLQVLRGTDLKQYQKVALCVGAIVLVRGKAKHGNCAFT